MEILFKRNKLSSSEFPVRIAPGEPLWFKDELYIGSVGTAAGGLFSSGTPVKIEGLPAVSSSDNGKVLQVVNGAWSLVTPVSVYIGNSEPSNSQGIDGDIYIQS